MPKNTLAELQTWSDGKLIGHFFEENDKQVLSLLYQRHGQWVFHKCIAMVKNEEVAKDLTHDIFLKAYLKLSTLKDLEKFRGWISTIAYNMCINYLNLKKDFREESVEDHNELSSLGDEEDREDKLLLEITLAQLRILLDKLPNSDRMVLLMRYQDDMSILEIKEALNIGESATKMRLKRAKEKLARLFEEHKTLAI
jgi:RNA polymerase sigma-70 factor (ECF subfamily)